MQILTQCQTKNVSGGVLSQAMCIYSVAVFAGGIYSQKTGNDWKLTPVAGVLAMGVFAIVEQIFYTVFPGQSCVTQDVATYIFEASFTGAGVATLGHWVGNQSGKFVN